MGQQKLDRILDDSGKTVLFYVDELTCDSRITGW